MYYTCIRLLETSLGDNDVIILAPPTTISVTEGDAVSLPCVGSVGATPTFTLDGGAVQSAATTGPYSLDFASISVSDNGAYTCEIGNKTANVTVSVAAMLSEWTIGLHTSVYYSCTL